MSNSTTGIPTLIELLNDYNEIYVPLTAGMISRYERLKRIYLKKYKGHFVYNYKVQRTSKSLKQQLVDHNGREEQQLFGRRDLE